MIEPYLMKFEFKWKMREKVSRAKYLIAKILYLFMRERFLTKYYSLPTSERKMAILIVNGQPYSWEAIYKEVINNTPMAQVLLNELAKRGLI